MSSGDVGEEESTLHVAYLNTKYVVENRFTLFVEKKCVELEILLCECKETDWAYITPCNPKSVLLSEEENNKRISSFKEVLRERKYVHIFEGEGVGMDGTWPPEKSFLILGIPLQEAVDIASLYEQNAIVCGSLHKLPYLHYISK